MKLTTGPSVQVTFLSTVPQVSSRWADTKPCRRSSSRPSPTRPSRTGTTTTTPTRSVACRQRTPGTSSALPTMVVSLGPASCSVSPSRPSGIGALIRCVCVLRFSLSVSLSLWTEVLSLCLSGLRFSLSVSLDCGSLSLCLSVSLN